MKRILLSSVIILSAFNIYASSRWVYITADTNNKDFFIDANSITQSGDSYTYWTKVNFEKRDADGDLSTKSQFTINCRTRELILRYYVFYDDIDGNGSIRISRKATGSWEPIVPESVNSAYYSYICKK